MKYFLLYNKTIVDLCYGRHEMLFNSKHSHIASRLYTNVRIILVETNGCCF